MSEDQHMLQWNIEIKNQSTDKFKCPTLGVDNWTTIDNLGAPYEVRDCKGPVPKPTLTYHDLTSEENVVAEFDINGVTETRTSENFCCDDPNEW